VRDRAAGLGQEITSKRLVGEVSSDVSRCDTSICAV
jgi:hypothetical protein